MHDKRPRHPRSNAVVGTHLKRVIVTPAVYPRLVEFLHFDIQSTVREIDRKDFSELLLFRSYTLTSWVLSCLVWIRLSWRVSTIRRYSLAHQVHVLSILLPLHTSSAQH